jgi:hypothetical protein
LAQACSSLATEGTKLLCGLMTTTTARIQKPEPVLAPLAAKAAGRPSFHLKVFPERGESSS